MKRHWFTRSVSVVLTLVLATALIASTVSYGKGGKAADQKVTTEKIGVVVTILPLVDFVQNVGGEKVDVSVMVGPGFSPHIYEPTPTQMIKLSEARVYVKVGSGVEFELAHMDDIGAQNRDMLVVNCSKGIELMGKDPHIWNSPVNVKIMVENICQGLIEEDPENKDYYMENKNRYLRELDVLDVYIHERLDGFTNRYFMIYHPAFGYFAEEYNLTQLAIEHEGKEPTPKVHQKCVDLAKKHNLSYVYVAPQFATKDAEFIAGEIGGRTIPLDPLSRYYIPNMGGVAASLSLEME
jgi:zinc transport system substrate-binding protein